jgi:hypothetical protein
MGPSKFIKVSGRGRQALKPFQAAPVRLAGENSSRRGTAAPLIEVKLELSIASKPQILQKIRSR